MVKSIEKGDLGDDLRVSYAADLVISRVFRADSRIRHQQIEAGFLRVLTPKLPDFTASLSDAHKSYPTHGVSIGVPLFVQSSVAEHFIRIGCTLLE